jgi:hypothetical protein
VSSSDSGASVLDSRGAYHDGGGDDDDAERDAEEALKELELDWD